MLSFFRPGRPKRPIGPFLNLNCLMDQNYYLHHPRFAHFHYPQYLVQYDCQPQNFDIPPPYTPQVVLCDATTFEEASQHERQQSFITHTHHHFATANAEEGGPIGWVPPDERGFQHQSASTNSIASNEISSIAYPIVDHHQPQFTPTFQRQQHQPPAAAASTSNCFQQPQPAPDISIYQMAGEAVSFYQEQSSDVIPGPTQTQPQLTGNIPPQVATAQAQISMLAPQAGYPSTLLDNLSFSTSSGAIQSQYLAYQPPHSTSTRAQTTHSGLSNSTSNFITSPTPTSSSTPTTHSAVVVQQPQPLAPSRTSSLAAWADVPPTPIVGPEHGPVTGPGVQEYHHHQHHHHQHPQSQYHHHVNAFKEEEGALQVYSPVQQQQMKVEMVGQDAKPLLAYGAQEHAIKQQARTQPPHHPAISRSPTGGAVPRVQALSRSATVPDTSPSAAQRPSVSANTTAAAAAAFLAPTRSVVDFNIASRAVKTIKASETVRQAAKLQVDMGQADPNSPSSHEARLKTRSLRRKARTAQPQHSPYHREFAARRGSSASQHDQAEEQQTQAHPHQPVVPSSRPTTALPTDQYGAQRTFIFHPYRDLNALTAEGGNQGSIPYGVPLPTPGMVTAVVSRAPVPAQHQTIESSGGGESSMSPDELAKGKAIDRNAADAAAMVMGEKKPFLACGFCRQRKIACGQRAPNARDNEIGEGPRTCNQCARRHVLCSFPSESRRGLRKTKPITKTIVQEDGSEVTIIIEDEEEIEELEPPPPPPPSSSPKKQSKSKKKGRGPMEWIIAADAWLITPAAWAAHMAAQDNKASGRNDSSGAQMCQ